MSEYRSTSSGKIAANGRRGAAEASVRSLNANGTTKWFIPPFVIPVLIVVLVVARAFGRA